MSKRLLPRSIRGRMLVLSLAATAVALVLAGLVIAAVLGRVVTQGIDRRLDAQIALLASTVDGQGHIDRARLTGLRDPLYAGPGWRWRIAAPGETLGPEDFALFEGPPDRDRHGERHRPPIGPQPREGADPQGEPIHARQVVLRTARGPVTLSAAAPRAVIQRPVREAMVPLLLLLATLGLLLALAGLLQVRYGLKPLDRLRAAVAAIRAGERPSIPQDQPAELQPLVAELHALARDTEAALATARASAANLAHALKTPVATLMLELRDEPARAAQVARIDATIRHHLSRARDRVAQTRTRTLLAPAVADLVATIARLHAGRTLSIETAVDPILAVAVDPADLDELVGNLLDNAARHASALVTIRAEPAERTVRLTISDDGPGIPAADRDRATAAGVRLDERGDGHGFGLAIARELAELYGGALDLADRTGGGLAVTITLPLAS